MSIPRVIHYCWFGHNPLPEDAQRCINSWRHYMPDCEIREWNEENFNVFMFPYTAEAYRLRKYAFVSDVARLWILYNYGGIYFDTDVEVVAPLDQILQRGAFMAQEAPDPSIPKATAEVALGLGMACKAGSPLVGEMLNFYRKKHLVSWSGRLGNSIVANTKPIIESHNPVKNDNVWQCDEFTIYPPEVFCPLNYFTNELHVTPLTRTIHHYKASWVYKKQSLTAKLKHRLNGIAARLTTMSIKNKKK